VKVHSTGWQRKGFASAPLMD